MVIKIYNKHFKFSDKKFLKYYVTTEKLGHFNAMFRIAALRALKWYRLADLAGDYDAAVAVRHILSEDLSCCLDFEDHYYEAYEWYEKAAEFGNINAAKNLVIMSWGDSRHFGGYCGIQYTPAFDWLKKVLEMEHENKNV